MNVPVAEWRISVQRILRTISLAGAGFYCFVATMMILGGLFEGIQIIRGNSPQPGDSILGMIIFAFCFGLYGGTIIAQWSWPRNIKLIIGRLLLSISGAIGCSILLLGAINFLNEPIKPSCGLPATAAMFHCLFCVAFFAVELATWFGWWLVRNKTRC